jgi:hypothetical protein
MIYITFSPVQSSTEKESILLHRLLLANELIVPIMNVGAAYRHHAPVRNDDVSAALFY